MDIGLKNTKDLTKASILRCQVVMESLGILNREILIIFAVWIVKMTVFAIRIRNVIIFAVRIVHVIIPATHISNAIIIRNVTPIRVGDEVVMVIYHLTTLAPRGHPLDIIRVSGHIMSEGILPPLIMNLIALFPFLGSWTDIPIVSTFTR